MRNNLDDFGAPPFPGHLHTTRSNHQAARLPPGPLAGTGRLWRPAEGNIGGGQDAPQKWMTNGMTNGIFHEANASLI